ncbi:MAG TPA: metal-sensitive transcriptional regulator [Gemmatimonadaceae bacterium]
MATKTKSAPLPIPLAHVASCGCGTHGEGDERKAIGVDADIKDRNLKRLRRIEGQVRGLQKMIETDRYCPEIMIQLASVHEALRAVARELMKNHLRHCVSRALRAGGDEADASMDELLELIYTTSR